MSPPEHLLAELKQAQNTVTNISFTSNFAPMTSPPANPTINSEGDEEDEEEVPMKRAVRMVVGLSQASVLASPIVEDAATEPTAAIDPPVKYRQESGASTSTASTERSSFQDHMSESIASMNLELLQDSGDEKDIEVHQVEIQQVPQKTSDSVYADDDGDVDGAGDVPGSPVFSMKKMYGRLHEEKTLCESFKRIVQAPVPRHNLEYVLISGGISCGKTALAESLGSKVRDQGGYYCVGTFDQMMQRGPVAPLVDAFAHYVHQVFEYGEDEAKMARSRILSMVDAKDLPSLTRIVPALAKLLDGTSTLDAHTLDDRETKKNDPSTRSCFHLSLMRLMRAISRPERPVVMVLDDLQWATNCVFEYLNKLVCDDLNDSFMFLGITRNDVSPTSAISKFLRDIEDQSVRITNIELDNLSLVDVQEMVDDSFAMPMIQSIALTKFLYECSCGNPFFISSSITTLQHEPRFLKFDCKESKWSINEEIADPYMSSCPIDFVTKKLQVSPRDQQKVLMVAACLGSHSTQTMIEAALQEDATDPLRELVTKGKLAFDEDEKTYTIRFNAVKTAAYGLIGEEIQPAYHLEIGLRLLQHLSPQDLEGNLFCVATQLMRGISLLQDPKQKYEVAALLVRVAEKAAMTFSFNMSLWALRNAYDLLGRNHWEEAYELTLVIYNYLAEMEFALDDNERVDELLEEIEVHGRTCCDKRQAYVTRVHILGVRGKPDLAIDHGICILRCLGVNLNTDHRRLNLIWSMTKIVRKVRGKSNEMLRRLPEMTDPKHLTAMQVLNLLFLDTFLHRRDLFPFVVLKMMKMSLQFGLSAMSSVAFAGYGALLAFSGRGENAQRFGKLALDLVDRFDANSYRSRVYGLFYGCIQPAVQPWRNSIKYLKEGHELGLTTGDTEFAIFCGNLHIVCMMDDGGFTVEQIIGEIQQLLELRETGQVQHINLSSMGAILMAFQEYGDPNGKLSEDSEYFRTACKDAADRGNSLDICMVYYSRIFCLVSTRQFQRALAVLDEKNSLCDRMDGSVFDSFSLYMEGLCVFANAREEQNKFSRKCFIQRGKKCMKALQKLATQNPDLCLGKATLLEAEYAAVLKHESDAKIKYSQAMALSAGHQNYTETILSKQTAGMHYIIDMNDPRSGLPHLEESIVKCKEFGGHAAAVFWEYTVRDIKDRRRFSNYR